MSYLIDILLLTYNNLSATKICIDNIYKHTLINDFKLFILDNNSQDGTIEYLQEIKNQYNNIYISFQQKNYGIIEGRNRCFDFSRENSDSKYIFIIDNDQYVQEGWLDSYLELMKSYDIVGIEAWLMRERDFYPYRKIKSKDEEFSYVGCGGLMIKNGIFEELGKFDERFSPMFFEDPDLIFRANEAGYKIGWNYNDVIKHRHCGPLLNKKTRQYFNRSWRLFQEKWKGHEIPVFKM